MLNLEKVSKEHLQDVINVKIYKRYKDFLDEAPENKVFITLKPNGFFAVSYIRKGQILDNEPALDYSKWLQEPEGEPDGTS